jgi:lipoprotein LprG
MTHGARRTTRTTLAAAVLLAAGSLAACSGGDAAETDDASGPEVLAAAKQQLDDTTGVHLALTTPELPDGVSGVLSAEGDVTKAPAFEGELKVLFSGLTADVPVISVGGKVYAKIPPLQTRWDEVDPADYQAPDPATLIDPDEGVPNWLTAAENVEKGEQERDGRTVVTVYTASIPGDAVKSAIPTAVAERSFDAEFRIDEDDRLVGGTFTGPFYASGGDVVYDLTLTDYGLDKDITAP